MRKIFYWEVGDFWNTNPKTLFSLTNVSSKLSFLALSKCDFHLKLLKWISKGHVSV